MALQYWIVRCIALDKVPQMGSGVSGHRIDGWIGCRRVSADEAMDIVRRHGSRQEGSLKRVQLLGRDRGIGERLGSKLPGEAA
jgi:hypothetical protein